MPQNKPKNLTEESVWDYPRPAICQVFAGSLKIIMQGEILAQTTRGFRTLETSHPPGYYIHPDDIDMARLLRNDRLTHCEWKGKAIYYDYRDENRLIENIAWAYPAPTAGFADIKDCLSFYASKCDACFVNDEQVQAQDGDFYGGWITRNLKGPFKGGPGTFGW